MSCDSDDLAVRSADLSYLLIKICMILDFPIFYDFLDIPFDILNILPWNGWDRCLYHIFPQQSHNSLISISGSHKPPSQWRFHFNLQPHQSLNMLYDELRIYFWPDGKRFWKSCSPRRRNMSTTCNRSSRVTGDFFQFSSFQDYCVLSSRVTGDSDSLVCTNCLNNSLIPFMTIVSCLRDRMESSPSLVGQKCPIIFGNLEDIYQFHSQCLLPELER